ncbi:MAG TPA: acetyl-CoA carboxylase biotin carboxyl carrier protein subunit, partial [Thermoanaerobaculia bacterium]|nr:acetyl-CoA carboxylase biotin carboxyl carrier protein subunit [Thermoanaerobaculia bacterium]
KEGDRVEKGQVILVLEAMKMEHAIRAPGAGVVARFFHGEGELVDAGTELAVIE